MAVVEEGAIIAGRYRLERTLGRGGMGSVWLARHLQLGSAVALKFIADEHACSADARARFEREAKASALLRTPNVAQVYDYGVEDGTPYIAMELLDGEDLHARLKREGRLSPAAAQVLVSQVCRALRRAHEAGLVHRDLKPANIFLARQDGEEIVKVLDFGIAKTTGLGRVGEATKTGTLLGSPYYMSPEQVRRSKEVDPRSDLWSLGVIIFQCLTGQLPFQGEELGELIYSICSADIPLASRAAPELGAEVDGFLARALARDPKERFQSAEELAAAFAALASPPKAREGQPSGPAEQAPPAPPGPIKGESGTLAPTGNSLVLPPRPGRRIGILIALLASALLLGLIALRALRAHAPSATPAASSPPASAPATESAAPLLTSPPSEPSSLLASPPAPLAPSASSVIAPSRSRPPPPPPRTTPPARKPGTSHDDPTDHM